MRSAILLEIFHSVDALEVDDTAKASFRDLLCRIGSGEGVKGLKSAVRIRYASDLLKKNCSKTTVMERLKARYGISRETAYRHIREASEPVSKIDSI
jgi:hypothetical protein